VPECVYYIEVLLRVLLSIIALAEAANDLRGVEPSGLARELELRVYVCVCVCVCVLSVELVSSDCVYTYYFTTYFICSFHFIIRSRT